MGEHQVLAKCEDFDFGVEDHGLPTICGHFEYEDGGCQGLGYMVDVAFLMRLMSVFRVDKLREINGKSCWVIFDSEENYRVGCSSDHIIRIDPLHRKDGIRFDIQAWRVWVKKGPGYSAYELLTGEKPKQ